MHRADWHFVLIASVMRFVSQRHRFNTIESILLSFSGPTHTPPIATWRRRVLPLKQQSYYQSHRLIGAKVSRVVKSFSLSRWEQIASSLYQVESLIFSRCGSLDESSQLFFYAFSPQTRPGVWRQLWKISSKQQPSAVNYPMCCVRLALGNYCTPMRTLTSILSSLPFVMKPQQ